MITEHVYFVAHLKEKHRAPNAVRHEWVLPFSIEIRAETGGLSGRRAYFDYSTESIVIAGHVVPSIIVEAAKKIPEGQSVWINELGLSEESAT